MNRIFGLPVYTTSLKNEIYDRKNIYNVIKENFNKGKIRDKNSEYGNLHHSLVDWDNPNFLVPDFSSLHPIYNKKIIEYLNNFTFTNGFYRFKYDIINYTCMESGQSMNDHFHCNCDFVAVHYFKFNPNVHSSTTFINTNSFSKYLSNIRPNLLNILNVNADENSWLNSERTLNVLEDDITFSPAILHHKVNEQKKSDDLRITIALNITVE